MANQRIEVRDITVPGLRIRASPAGETVRRVSYFRFRHGDTDRLDPRRFGESSATAPGEAPDLALEHHDEQDRGIDPRSSERTERARVDSPQAYTVKIPTEDVIANAARKDAETGDICQLRGQLNRPRSRRR